MGSVSDLNSKVLFPQIQSFGSETAMNTGKTLFVPIIDFLPSEIFHRIVALHGGDKDVRSLTFAEHFELSRN